MMKVEITKLRKRKMTWILLAAMVAIYALIYSIHIIIIKMPPDGMTADMLVEAKAGAILPGSLDLIFSLAQGFGTLLLVILIGAGVGSEYGWGSIRQVLTRKGVRYEYVLSKLFAYLIFAVIGLVIAVVVGFIMSMITTTIIEGSIDWSLITGSVVGDIFRNFGWTVFSLIPYILLAITFAILGRSALVGIGASLGYIFLEMFAVPLLRLGNDTVAKISHYLIGTNASALLPSAEMGGGFGSSLAAPSTAWAVVALIIYSVALLGISLWLFKKRDITA